MTVNEFKNIDPGDQYIKLLYSGTNIIAVNVSTTDCLERNITQILIELDKLILTVGGINYNLIVTSSEEFTNYYHYTVEEVSIPNIGNIEEDDCTDIITIPAFGRAGFDKSEYQAILNNADSSRTTALIFDVDRQKMEIQASNIELINNNTATLAEFQELNYTSIGITNSRYSGAKTSRRDYGTISGISLGTFDGVVYNSNVENSSICSQSAATTFENQTLLGVNEEYNVGVESPNGLPSYSRKSTNPATYSGYISGSSSSPASLDLTQTTITVDWLKTEEDKLQVNGLYALMTVSTEEFFILKAFTFLSQKDSSFNTYSLVVDRAASGRGYAHLADVVTTYRITIKKVEASQIFEFDGNKISTLSNRKVYLPLNDTIVHTGKNGLVFSGSLACN